MICDSFTVEMTCTADILSKERLMHFIFATERKVDLNGTIKLSLVTVPPNTVFPCNVLRIHCASHCFLVLEVEECGVNFV